MKKFALVFGSVCGIAIALFTFGVTWWMGDMRTMSTAEFQKMEIMGYMRYLVLLMGIFMAMRAYKQAVGSMTYRTAVKVGVSVAAVIAVWVGIYEAIYTGLINPDFFASAGEQYLKGLAASGAPPEQILEAKNQMAASAWVQTPLMVAVSYIIESLLIGTLGTLILARFFRERRNERPDVVVE